jgi:hypothetical protein
MVGRDEVHAHPGFHGCVQGISSRPGSVPVRSNMNDVLKYKR